MRLVITIRMGIFEMLFGKQERRLEVSKEAMQERAKKEGMKAAAQTARTQPEILEHSARA